MKFMRRRFRHFSLKYSGQNKEAILFDWVMHLEYPCAMRRRNTHRRRERYVYTCGVIVAIVFYICTDISAAPASYDSLLPQSSEIAEYFSDIAGCYYNFQRYEEGDRIVTNEPCLNCTCHNRMLMCYLRVCPFTKAIGQDCTIEKKPDQCCPIITCPEVPVKLLTSSTTSSPTPTTQTTEVGFHDNYGCSIHDFFYADGAQVPPDPKKPCELCYCIRNRTACVMQECILHVEGCKPVFQDGVCCPVRYDCDYEKEVISTPLLPTSGGVIKSTTYAAVIDCQYGNQSYSDGELITTDKPCEHCYCMRGDIVCAVQDCGEPLRGKDCVPTMPPPERCCPSYYDCPNDTLTTENAIKGSEIFSTEPILKFSSTEKVNAYDATIKTDRTPAVLSQEQIYEKLGENKKPTEIPLLFENASDTTVPARSTTTLKSSSKHPSEDILLDTNSMDAGEHFTFAIREKITSSSTLYEEVTSKVTAPTSEQYATIETVSNKSPSLSLQGSISKPQFPPSVVEQNVPMMTVDSVDVTTAEIIPSTLNGNYLYSSSHTVSEEAAFATEAAAAAYTKLSENMQTEANKVNETITESFNDNSLVTTKIVPNNASTDKATYEMTTNSHPKPDINEDNTLAATSHISEEHEYTSQPDQYPTSILELDKSTTIIDKEQQVTKFSDEPIITKGSSISDVQNDFTTKGNSVSELQYDDVTTNGSSVSESQNDVTTKGNSVSELQNNVATNGSTVSELQNEGTTESLNTVSDKNTEPLMQNDIISPAKLPEQVTTQQSVENIETTVKHYSPALVSSIITDETSKPPSVSEKYGGTTEFFEEVTTVSSSGVVPGEGSCLVDGITYPNTSIIESSNPCHSKCQCLSSIPTCTLVTCSSPPVDPKCMPIQMRPESCCPVYVCEGNEQPVPLQHIPSHNQVMPDKSALPHTSEEVATASSSFVPAVLSSSTTVENFKHTELSPESPASVASENETPTTTQITESNLSDSSKPQDDVHVPELPLVTTDAVVGETKNPQLQNENDIITAEVAVSEETTISVHKNVSDSSPVYSESTTIQHVYGDETEAQVNTEPSLQAENDVFPQKHHQPSSSVATTVLENEANEITTFSSTAAVPIKDIVTENENIVNEVDEVTMFSSTAAVSVKDGVTENENIEISTEGVSVENNEIVSDTSPSAQNEKFGSTPATIMTTKSAVQESNGAPTTEYSVTSHSASDESSHDVTSSSFTELQDEFSINTSVPYQTTVGNMDETNVPEDQNNDIPTTIPPSVTNKDEFNVIVTEAVSSSSLNNKFSEISVAFITTTKPDLQNDPVKTTLSSGSENVEYTTTNEKDQTVVPVSEYLATSKPFSFVFTSLVTPESVKLTEKVPLDVTETYESITTSSVEMLNKTTTVGMLEGVSKSSVADESKPSTEADVTMIESSSSSLTSIQTDEINSLGSNSDIISNKFGTVAPTEHSMDLPLATESVYNAETTAKESQSYVSTTPTVVTEFVDVKTTLSSSPSSESEIIGESVVTMPGSISPSVQENVQTTKNPETNDVQPQEITTTKLLASSESNLLGIPEQQNDVSTTTEIKVSNSSNKLGSAITNLPPLLEISSENNYSLVQQSTWTRKPVDEEVTSEPNYYPQAPMYPPGIESSNAEGTGMEEYDEDNNAFGPGTCRYTGKVYVSAQQIPRDDPCDFCFCFRSDIICLQQSCPPPIHGCRQEPIQGFCCPRYECPVARDAAFNSTTTTTTTTTTLPSRPPRFPLESYRSSNRKTGCVIHGYFYNVGDNISIASGPCLECLCGSDGRMKCDPKSCSPEPYVQQMMADSAFHR